MRKTGTVVEIRGRWFARWTVDGKRVYGEARRTYDEADADRIANKPTPIKKPVRKSDVPTFDDWAYEMMQGDYGISLADSTFDTNETIRTVHIEGSEIGKAKMSRIDRVLCLRWARGIRVLKTRKDGDKVVEWKEPPSASYLARCVAFGSKMMTLYKQHGGRLDNPFEGISRYLPKVEERENRTLAPDEAVRLLNPATRTDAIMFVAMVTGMRRGEILRLEWRHIGNGVLKVPGTKSKKAKRVAMLTPEIADVLTSQPRRGKYIFTTDEGKPLSPRNVTRDVNARKKQLGIPAETRLHDLRGSFASLLIEQGEDPRKVMELLGHADPRTTLKLYARSRNEEKTAAVTKMMDTIKNAQKQVDERERKSGSG
jgi:integrase